MKKEHKRLLLFLALSFAVLGYVMYTTVTPETVQAVQDMSVASILLILLVWMIDYLSDSAALWFAAKSSSQGYLPFRGALMLTGLRTFFNTTTPFHSGGAPVIIYALRKYGMSYGEGTSISLIKLLSITFWYFTFSFFSAIILIIHSTQNESFLFLGIGLIVLAAGAMYILMFLSFIFPRPLIILAHAVAGIGKRFRRFSSHGFQARVLHEAFLARKGIKDFFRRSRGLFLLTLLASCIAALAQVYLLVIIFTSLGLGDELLIDIIIRSSILLFLVRFMPTPGGAGFGEGLYIVLFAGVAPVHLLGVAVLLWRILLNFSKAGIGAVVFSVTTAEKKKEKLSLHD